MSQTVCKTCVMDTTDPQIEFFADGTCNHCRRARHSLSKWVFTGAESQKRMDRVIQRIKRERGRSEFDCVIGLSGGVDSSYLALLAHRLGLKVLLVHVDAGWNSELAVANIEIIIAHTGFELHTVVVDWGAMQSLQRAFLLSGAVNQDVPQDHVFFAALDQVVRDHSIKWQITGHNYRTESIMPAAWWESSIDTWYIKGIHAKYGSGDISSLPMVNPIKAALQTRILGGLREAHLLDLMDYHSETAKKELAEIGWRIYPSKHFESRFTRFYQGYYLPKRFGWDKRKAHLSSRIVSGEISRDEALRELESPPYDPLLAEEDMNYICKKLKISTLEMEQLLRAPLKPAGDVPEHKKIINFVRRVTTAYEMFVLKTKEYS